MVMSIRIETDEQVEHFIEATTKEGAKCLVIEWRAEWCHSCKAAEEYLRILRANHPEFTFAVADADEVQIAAKKYGVKALPTLMVFRGGRKLDEFLGVCPDASQALLCRCEPGAGTCQDIKKPSDDASP